MRRKVLWEVILAAEWLFIVISLLVAGIGIGLAVLFYVRNPRLPEIWATKAQTSLRSELQQILG